MLSDYSTTGLRVLGKVIMGVLGRGQLKVHLKRLDLQIDQNNLVSWSVSSPWYESFFIF